VLDKDQCGGVAGEADGHRCHGAPPDRVGREGEAEREEDLSAGAVEPTRDRDRALARNTTGESELIRLSN